MTISEKIVVVIFVVGVAAIYILEVLFLVTFAINKLGAEQTSNTFWRKPAVFVHVLAIIGIMCFLYAYFIEPYWIEVKTVRIRTEKLSKTNLRLIHISDLHCDKKIGNERKVIELINAMEPDIIVFTGDALKLNTPGGLPVFKDTMKNLKANVTKLAVRGNVDIWYFPNVDLFSGTSFEVLDQKTIKLPFNR